MKVCYTFLYVSSVGEPELRLFQRIRIERKFFRSSFFLSCCSTGTTGNTRPDDFFFGEVKTNFSSYAYRVLNLSLTTKWNSLWHPSPIGAAYSPGRAQQLKSPIASITGHRPGPYWRTAEFHCTMCWSPGKSTSIFITWKNDEKIC